MLCWPNPYKTIQIPFVPLLIGFDLIFPFKELLPLMKI